MLPGTNVSERGGLAFHSIARVTSSLNECFHGAKPDSSYITWRGWGPGVLDVVERERFFFSPLPLFISFFDELVKGS